MGAQRIHVYYVICKNLNWGIKIFGLSSLEHRGELKKFECPRKLLDLMHETAKYF